MRFVVSKDFLDTGSTPVSSTILPRSQAVRHQTLTLTCGSSNLPEATNLIFHNIKYILGMRVATTPKDYKASN